MADPVVACVGVATWDTIALVPRPLTRDGRVEALAIVEACGGPAATAAVTLARLGVPVAFVGVVGDDPAGLAVRQTLVREGVDVSAVRISATQSTARAVVLVHEAERSIVVRPSAPATLAGVSLPPAAWYHVDQLGWTVLSAAPAGARLSVDHGNAIPGLRLDGVDLYVPTESRIRERYPGRDVADALRAAVGEGAGAAVVTLGERGAVAFDGDLLSPVPANDVVVTSTLGAGDVFHGALLAGLVDGLDLAGATALATTVAALSCAGLDGQSAIPRRADLPPPGGATRIDDPTESSEENP